MTSGERETDEHGRSGFRLVPHPVEFPAVQDAVTMALAGHSLSKVLDEPSGFITNFVWKCAILGNEAINQLGQSAALIAMYELPADAEFFSDKQLPE